ncbi:MAG: hypothetical protein L0Y66_24335 [Myxococcaceae bacterium]|nr:hypothetical protein [Myxococcaceae bacterium]MCI0671893.1 hypothetical protein [Myxococcaceae bacterium]
MNELAVQLLLVLAVAFATAWLGASISLVTHRRHRRRSKLRVLARRRRGQPPRDTGQDKAA